MRYLDANFPRWCGAPQEDPLADRGTEKLTSLPVRISAER